MSHSSGEHSLKEYSSDFQCKIIITSTDFHPSNEQASVYHTIKLTLSQRWDFNYELDDIGVVKLYIYIWFDEWLT